MRVLHVVPAYPDDAHHHQEGQNYKQLLRRLTAAGTPCVAVAGRMYADSPTAARDAQVDVRRFVFGRHNARLGELRMTPLRAFRYRRAGIRAILDAHAAAPAALLHAHTPVPCGLLALAAGRRLGLPVLLSLHGSDILVFPERSAAFRRTTDWVLHRVDRVVAVADHLADAARAYVPPVEVEVIPIGYDNNLFRLGLAAAHREPTAVSTRNLAPLYSGETLVVAAGAVKNDAGFRVHMYGEGPERARLEAAAAGAPVTFHGFAPPEQVSSALQQAAIYVSCAGSDGTSVSLLEAMACGVYPIVTDIPANRRWIEDGVTGRLVPARDPAALAAAITQALADADGRERAADLNATRVATAAWSAVIPRYQALYAAMAAPAVS